MTDSACVANARIQRNTAEAALRSAKEAQMACLSAADKAAALLADSQGDVDQRAKEADQLHLVNEVILRQMIRQQAAGNAVKEIVDVVQGDIGKMNDEIDRLKGEIRLERRRFLDSEPQVSPAVGGIYFLRSPDNQVLLAFLTAFGAFLLFAGLLVILGKVPVLYFENMTMGERVKVTLVGWIVSVIVMLIGFFIFT